jgi:prevent-host-death family protein
LLTNTAPVALDTRELTSYSDHRHIRSVIVERAISKSKFKPNALRYFRQVQESGEPLIITDRGRPVLKIVPYSGEADEVLALLRGTVLSYEGPLEPVAVEWEALGDAS